MFRLVHVSTVADSLRAFRDQLAFLHARDVELHAITSSGPYALQLEQELPLTIHRVPLSRRIQPWRDLRSLRHILHVLEEVRPDIVHAHTPKAGLLAMWAAKIARIPVRIYHLRGLRYVTERSWRRMILKRCEVSACHGAHQVFCVSRSLRDFAISDGLIAADRIQVLGNGGHGLDTRQRFNPALLPSDTRLQTRRKWRIPQDACVVGFVGRMVVDKGIRELWEAWRILRDKHPNLHLLLVGPIEAEYPLPEDMMRAIESDARVHWTGADFNTPPLYSAMDIACLPSYREGLPKMPLEAAAMGLPVVTTDVPGCVDSVVADHTGMLVHPFDAGGLAAALEQYIVNSSLRQKHGANGRQWVAETFQPQAIHDALLREYLRLIDIAGCGQSLQQQWSPHSYPMPRKAA